VVLKGGQVNKQWKHVRHDKYTGSSSEHNCFAQTLPKPKESIIYVSTIKHDQDRIRKPTWIMVVTSSLPFPPSTSLFLTFYRPPSSLLPSSLLPSPIPFISAPPHPSSPHPLHHSLYHPLPLFHLPPPFSTRPLPPPLFPLSHMGWSAIFVNVD